MNATAKPFYIGTVRLSAPVILAPMAGVCDLPYRVIAHRYGAALVCTEMVSDKGLLYHNVHTQDMLRIAPEEHPVSMQIFGADPHTMAKAAASVEEAGADIIDINMGCPVKKVVTNGEGAALMRDLPRAEAIIRAVVQAVSIPVTVKMRTGWNEEEFTAPELAKRAEAAGAAAVTVHGRTREQFYSGKADLKKIAAVVRAVSIPVIGNGDIIDGPSAARMFDETGCQAIMVGRGAQGNPWIFHRYGLIWNREPYSPRRHRLNGTGRCWSISRPCGPIRAIIQLSGKCVPMQPGTRKDCTGRQPYGNGSTGQKVRLFLSPSSGHCWKRKNIDTRHVYAYN